MDYVLQREDVKVAWHEYTHHEFVQRMGDGTLSPETFKSYMIQDYLYLVYRCFISSLNLADWNRFTLPEPTHSLATKRKR